METLDMSWRPLAPPEVCRAWPAGLALPRAVPEDPRLQALARVLASRAFARTTRLASFLHYVCIASLEGRSELLNEQHIGNRVFDRPEQYNPAEDTIVRTTARLLRLRLASYYEAEGREDPLRICIPRGGYAPVFSPAASVDATPAPIDAEASDMKPPPLNSADPLESDSPNRHDAAAPAKSRARLWRVALGAALVTAIVSGLCAKAFIAGPEDIGAKFWASLFSRDQDTLLVPADSALVFYQHAAHREVGLDDYAANRLAADPEDAVHGDPQNARQFRTRRQTAVTSVALAAEFGKLAQSAPKRFHVRFARDLQLADLKRSNAILVGVRQANPWVELFRSRLNFHIDWDSASDKFLIRNDRPLAGEQALYEFSADDPGKRAYASIAYLHGAGGEGRVLLLGGTTAAGTEAAAEFLLDPRRFAAVLERASLPDGSVGEFEVLLQSVLQANGSADTKVLAVRIKPV